MSRVRSKDTAPERLIRSALHKMGFRFRLHRKDLPGCPDIVLPQHGTVIFVHGCFWHQHRGCPKATIPKTREAFWKDKLTSNVKRDEQDRRQLRREGWRVLVVWECDIAKRWPQVMDRLRKALRTNGNTKAK